MNKEFYDKADARFQKFLENGVDVFFHRYIHIVKKNFGHDVLIIDNKHFVINFPTINIVNHATKGILFENQKELAEDLANWFDIFVKDGVEGLEISKKEYFKKHKS